MNKERETYGVAKRKGRAKERADNHKWFFFLLCSSTDLYNTKEL
jgi:hypothetical protein